MMYTLYSLVVLNVFLCGCNSQSFQPNIWTVDTAPTNSVNVSGMTFFHTQTGQDTASLWSPATQDNTNLNTQTGQGTASLWSPETQDNTNLNTYTNFLSSQSQPSAQDASRESPVAGKIGLPMPQFDTPILPRDTPMLPRDTPPDSRPLSQLMKPVTTNAASTLTGGGSPFLDSGRQSAFDKSSLDLSKFGILQNNFPGEDDIELNGYTALSSNKATPETTKGKDQPLNPFPFSQLDGNDLTKRNRPSMIVSGSFKDHSRLPVFNVKKKFVDHSMIEMQDEDTTKKLPRPVITTTPPTTPPTVPPPIVRQLGGLALPGVLEGDALNKQNALINSNHQKVFTDYNKDSSVDVAPFVITTTPIVVTPPDRLVVDELYPDAAFPSNSVNTDINSQITDGQQVPAISNNKVSSLSGIDNLPTATTRPGDSPGNKFRDSQVTKSSGLPEGASEFSPRTPWDGTIVLPTPDSIRNNVISDDKSPTSNNINVLTNVQGKDTRPVFGNPGNTGQTPGQRTRTAPLPMDVGASTAMNTRWQSNNVIGQGGNDLNNQGQGLFQQAPAQNVNDNINIQNRQVNQMSPGQMKPLPNGQNIIQGDQFKPQLNQMSGNNNLPFMGIGQSRGSLNGQQLNDQFNNANAPRAPSTGILNNDNTVGSVRSGQRIGPLTTVGGQGTANLQGTQTDGQQLMVNNRQTVINGRPINGIGQRTTVNGQQLIDGNVLTQISGQQINTNTQSLQNNGQILNNIGSIPTRQQGTATGFKGPSDQQMIGNGPVLNDQPVKGRINTINGSPSAFIPQGNFPLAPTGQLNNNQLQASNTQQINPNRPIANANWFQGGNNVQQITSNMLPVNQNIPQSTNGNQQISNNQGMILNNQIQNTNGIATLNGQQSLTNTQAIRANGVQVNANGQQLSVNQLNTNGQQQNVIGQQIDTISRQQIPNGQRLNINSQQFNMNGLRVNSNGQRVDSNGQRMDSNGQLTSVNGKQFNGLQVRNDPRTTQINQQNSVNPLTQMNSRVVNSQIDRTIPQVARNSLPTNINNIPQSGNTRQIAMNSMPVNTNNGQQLLNTQQLAMNRMPVNTNNGQQLMNTQQVAMNNMPVNTNNRQQLLNTQQIAMNNMPVNTNNGQQLMNAQRASINSLPVNTNSGNNLPNNGPQIVNTQISSRTFPGLNSRVPSAQNGLPSVNSNTGRSFTPLAQNVNRMQRFGNRQLPNSDQSIVPGGVLNIPPRASVTGNNQGNMQLNSFNTQTVRNGPTQSALNNGQFLRINGLNGRTNNFPGAPGTFKTRGNAMNIPQSLNGAQPPPQPRIIPTNSQNFNRNRLVMGNSQNVPNNLPNLVRNRNLPLNRGPFTRNGMQTPDFPFNDMGLFPGPMMPFR